MTVPRDVTLIPRRDRGDFQPPARDVVESRDDLDYRYNYLELDEHDRPLDETRSDGKGGFVRVNELFFMRVVGLCGASSFLCGIPLCM